MNHNKKFLAALTALSAALLFFHASMAAVSADQAATLKSTLTPLGGERAGNADGSIPAWTGGLTKVDAAYKDGGKRGDPYAGDQPVLTITAQNMAQYADKLTPGIQAMLKKYPDSYKVVVYPTHRSAAAPQSVYDATFANATSGKLVMVLPGQCLRVRQAAFHSQFLRTVQRLSGTICCVGAEPPGTPASRSI